MLAAVPGIDDLAMTTNGTLLSGHAAELARAGLRRVNVSLDTLRPERFRSITACGRLADVLAGLDAARDAELRPIKINMVVIRGTNDDEIVDFARRTLADSWHVRFIELMPVGNGGPMRDRWRDRVVTAPAIRAQIEAALGTLEAVRPDVGSGPATYYRLPGAAGTVGFITPVSDHFCYQCNRLRLTADGQLRLCLLSDIEIDLRSALRQGAGVREIEALLLDGIQRKPKRHRLSESRRPKARVMSEIGG
jgi:cyclic pyranopterin phosphate synthase